DFHVTGVQTCALPISTSFSGSTGMPRIFLCSWIPAPRALRMVPPLAPASRDVSRTSWALPLGTTVTMRSKAVSRLAIRANLLFFLGRLRGRAQQHAERQHRQGGRAQ